MKKLKNKKISKLIFIYYAIVIILIIQGVTFSRYLITASSEAQINTSKFSFKVTDQMSNVELDLKNTILSNLYSDSEIVPGSNGKLELEMDFSDIETATKYNVTLNKEKSKLPSNIKLYADSSYTVEFSGYSGITDVETQKVTRYVYWKWNYTTNDETEEWMGKDISIVLNITAEQRTN